ncbi:MAG: Ig-like domain-containing protein, partial [Patescibacteria group bacterium]|nr:Ig-like domain-containing protein [Patescibacteria group bacterium]
KGSAVSVVGEKISLCGNGLLEAGEDCDPPNKNAGCGLNCLYIGNTSTSTCGNGLLEHEFGEECDTADANTKIGCGANCLHIGSEKTTGAIDADASICGNGQIGKGEDCDIGISGSIANPKSSLNCSEKCLHTGTRLSGLWCYNSRLNYSNYGFIKKDYEAACANSASICGNKISEPEEDPECDTQSGVNQNCNDYCLLKTGDSASDNSSGNNCASNSSLEGCSGEKHQHIGSSLNYSSPSSCGDGEVGLGEDVFCEGNGLTRNREFWNPWALAIGIGEGEPDMSRVPPAQWAQVRVESAEKSAVTGKVFSGAGEFIIYCGYQSDDECRRFGDNYGLGKNTCCYPKPVLTSTMPENNSRDVCPNTYLEARFDKEIDKNTLAGNVLLAKGIDTGVCGDSGLRDITGLVYENIDKIETTSWYKKIFVRVGEFLSRIFGHEASAADIAATAWCAVNDYGSADVIPIPDTSPTSTRVIIKLKEPLAINSKYAIVLQEGIKDTKGVSIGKALSGRKINWKITTRGSICEINSLSVVPDKYYFSRAGSSITLDAQAKTFGGETIQPIMGFYGWQIIWGPKNNDFVTITDTISSQNQITAQNRNGEIDIIASANIKAEDNKYTPTRGIVATGVSRITIFLCENPWPPKDLYLSGAGPYAIFPFTDEEGNNDGTDLNGNFNNSILAPSDFGGYFNFKTYYCADAGEYGILDDLPFMKVTAQTSAKLLEKTGVCQKTGASCNALLPCQSVCVYRGGANDGNLVLNSNGNFITCAIGSDCGLGADCFAATCDNPEKVLKRFLFTSETNRDVIGIQIFPNTSRLSLREWFNNSKEQGGQGFTGQMQDVKINGYDALTDGSNIYLDALNYTSDKKLYTNIYLFSINADAKQETKKVFEQMMQNLKLNSNLSNYGYCGINADTISEPYTSCENDLDCPSGQICSAKVNKLKRNYERLRDLKTIENNLNEYFEKNTSFPDLKEGTYLAGQTLSAWPSWSVLSSAVGYNLPADPINELGKSGTCSKSTNIFCVGETCPSGETCVLHDPATGWSVEDRRFSFACNLNSYAYRYLYKENSKNYEVRAKFEEPFLNQLASGGVAGWINFVKSFVNIANFKTNDSSGICVFSGSAFEVSSYNQGVCGDKIINVGSEECDPIGSVSVDASQCSVSGGSAQKKTCLTGCVWGAPQSILCSQLSKCGNNIVESGEKCDDGVLNGKFNHCSSDCKSKYSGEGYCGDGVLSAKYEICDILVRPAGSGLCVGGTNYGGVCISVSDCPTILRGEYAGCEIKNDILKQIFQEKYALKKENSCGWDCQSYGPYCGDGAVQIEYEECEDNVACVTSDNKNGFKECNKLTCKFKTGECVVPTVVPITSATPACGDGVVGSDEACDNGVANNGKTCVAEYGKTCSYCSSDCKNTIAVQSKEYCGDGIINGDEVCDTSPDAGIIWARNAEDACGDDAIGTTGLQTCATQPNLVTHGYKVPLCSEEKTDPYSFKKGTKQCLNNCKTLQSNCV